MLSSSSQKCRYSSVLSVSIAKTISKLGINVIDNLLAKLFKLLWSSKHIPALRDTEEVRFIKENTREDWALDLAITVRGDTLRPFYNLFLLLWPYPRKFALPPLRSSEEYFNNRDLADLLGHDSWRLGPFLPYRDRDTPLRSLYRMHAFACACDEPAFGYEAQYFYSHPEPEWRLENVPDPRDPDPVRYAILAGLVEMMVLSFNDRFEMGLPRLGEGLAYSFYGKLQKEGREVQVPEERPPAWAAAVPPVPGPLVVLRKDGEKTCARPWLDRNVLLGGAGYLDWA